MKGQIEIFIVDDNKVFTLALKGNIETVFDNKKIKIHSFESGEECIQKFDMKDPQVVIMDYHLDSKYPDAMDGIMILDWIKKQCSETCVIMLSNNEDIDVAVKAFRYGASDYIVKNETKFSKINYSLSNIFKVIEAKREARRYKRLLFGLSLLILLLAGGVMYMQLFYHSLF